MDLHLKDNVVVVVGAASGIGRATATEFLREGAHVCWLDKAATVMQVANEVGASQPFTRVVDVADYEATATVAETVIEQFGRCDHVVACMGLGSGKFGYPFWNLEPADWQEVVNVNLIGAVNVAHAFVPKMLPSKFGTFCFLASVAGQIGSQTDPPYSAAKAALINFAHCAAKDLAPHDIRVNVVSPGMVKTPMNRQVWKAWRQVSPQNTLTYDEWAEQKIAQVTPLQRWQTPEEVAAMITFLASSRAKSITGQTLNVDGGQVMHA